MKKACSLSLAALLVLLMFSGCATLSVKAPTGFFLSTGDYVPNVQTLGIVQTSTTVWAFLFFFDVNAVRQQLFASLIEKAQAAGGDGLTDVEFFWKPSPFTVATIWVLTPMIDCSMEGVVIKKPLFQ